MHYSSPPPRKFCGRGLNRLTQYLISIVLVLLAGCTKLDHNMLHTDANPEDEPVTDPSLLRVIARLEQNDVKTIRLRNLLKNYRKPFYNKSLFVYPKSVANSRGTNSSSTSSADTTVLIPLVPPRQQVVPAFIKATLGTDSVNLSLHFDVSYPQYGFADSSTTSASYPAEGYALTYMKLNQAVFNYNLFRINDRRLFHNGRNYSDTVGNRLLIRLRDPNVTNNSRMEYIVNCNEFTNIVFHCPKEEGECTGPGGACDGWPCPICTTTSYTTECETFTIPSPGGSSGSPVYVPPSPPTTGPSSGGTGGGSGNGPDPNTPPPGTTGWTPEAPQDPTNNHDPCEVASAQAARLDSIWQNAPIDSALGTIATGSINQYEYGFHIVKKFDNSPNPPYWLNPRLTVPGVHTQQSPRGVTIPGVVGNVYGNRWLASLHTHPDSTVAAPSAEDIFKLFQPFTDPPPHDFFASFVVANDGSTYALTIADMQKLRVFKDKERDNLDDTTKGFKRGSELGKIFYNAYDFFLEKFKDHQNPKGKAFEMATTATLSGANSGITLHKRDASGQFKPIMLKASPHPKDANQTVYDNACN